ncbi:MAG TPA: tRNA (adenosine(37)-N6)-threonylcarbamoyltransferase complex dimerization subunit type 1 TsaB [Sedimenticola sp.]|nr:tRNA (adenosine(37)-N6)-threonylcarbamoyltransferase complex dimerization subunit type 1 TsaB [Sedimenticola sp.]
MRLLAIETAAEACSAALLLDDDIRVRFEVEPRRQSELILPMMDSLLAEGGVTLGQLDALAFGRGPGSFTGVRIAVGVIQGAAFGAGLPVVPVSTLAALAQRAFREHGRRSLLAAFDARMGELYWGGFRVDGQGLVVPCFEEQVAGPAQVTLPPAGAWFGVGSGWETYRDTLAGRLAGSLRGVDPGLLASAHDVALLAAAGWRAGEAVPPEQAMPVYLRDKVASRPAPPRIP